MKKSGTAVRLRYRRAAALRFFAATLALAVYTGVLFSGEPAGTIAWLVGIVLAAFLLIYLRRRFWHRYVVRDRLLVVSSPFGRTEIDLPAVADIDLRSGYHEFGRNRSATLLVLVLDDVQIVLGDSVSRLRFDSPGLLAIAQGLQLSGLSRTREVGAQLERLARSPDAPDAWPVTEKFPRHPLP